MNYVLLLTGITKLIFCAEGQRPNRMIPLEWGGRTYSLAFSPDGRTLYSLEDHLFLWENASAKLRVRLSPGLAATWSGMEVFPDGKKMLLMGPALFGQFRVGIWGLPRGNCLVKLAGDQHKIRVVSISPDGQELAIVYDDDPRIHFVDVRSGKRRLAVKLPGRKRNGGAWDGVFSPDGRFFALSVSKQFSCDSEIFLYDCKKRSIRSLGCYPESPIVALRFSLNATKLILGDLFGHVYSLDLKSLRARRIRTAKGTLRKVEMAISHDGLIAVIENRLGKVEVWDLQAARILGTLRGGKGVVERIRISPNLKTIAVEYDDEGARRIALWDTSYFRTKRGRKK